MDLNIDKLTGSIIDLIDSYHADRDSIQKAIEKHFDDNDFYTNNCKFCNSSRGFIEQKQEGFVTRYGCLDCNKWQSECRLISDWRIYEE